MTDNDPSKCSSCDHKVDYPSDEGYCYMFKTQPKQHCSKHTVTRPNNILTPSLQEFRSYASDR